MVCVRELEIKGLMLLHALQDDCLFYGTRVNRLGKMSIPEGVRETYLTGHLDLIRTIAGNAKTGRLVTGSYDRTVIVSATAATYVHELRLAHVGHSCGISNQVPKSLYTSSNTTSQWYSPLLSTART